MPLANRSTTLNAVVAAAASDIPQGYAFCETSPFVGFVVADTTNRAAVGGEIAGVAVSVGIAGRAFSGVAVGRCEPEEVGIIGGSGDYVEVTSTGALTRSSTTGANTIGNYLASGAIHVDPALQFGGAVTGNATAIQGVTVSSASGAASHELRGDGTNIRSVLADAYHLEDFGTVDTTGATASDAAAAAAISAMPAGSTLLLPRGTIKLTSTVLIADDTAGGNKSGIKLVGHGGTASRSMTTLSWYPTEPSSTVITYVSHATSGSQRMVRYAGWTGLDATLHTGQLVTIWNSANASLGIVAKVHDANTCTVFFPLYNGASDATLSGSICGRIHLPMLDIRAGGVKVERLKFTAGSRAGILTKVGNPSRAGSNLTTRVRFVDCRWEVPSWAAPVDFGHVIGAPYVPESGNTYYSASQGDGTDTNIPRVATTAAFGNGQVDYIEHENCYMQYAGHRACILHGSQSGQSVSCTWSGGDILPVRAGYLMPAQLNASAQMHFSDAGMGVAEDYCWRTYGSNRPWTFERCYTEAAKGVLAAYGTASGGQVVSISNGTQFVCSAPHPSGNIIDVNHLGPLHISDARIAGLDSQQWRVRMTGGSTTEFSRLVAEAVMFWGSSTFTSGLRAEYSGSCRGPFKLTGTEELDLEVDPLSGGAHVKTFTFALADFQAAGAGTTWPDLGLSEIYLTDIMAVVRHQASAAGTTHTAWGDVENIAPWIGSTTLGATSRIKLTTHARGGKVDMSTVLGIAASTALGAAATQMATDTLGVLDAVQQTTGVPCELTAIGCLSISASGAVEVPFPTILGKQYNRGTIVPERCYVGGRFSPPGGSFTMAAASTKDVAETRARLTTTVRLVPTNAAAATLMAGASSLYVAKASTAAGTSFRVATADGAAAAGTETFDYTLEETW